MNYESSLRDYNVTCSSPKPKRIGWLEGRPKRDKVINSDDLINLSIALHKSKTLEEFLERT